MPRKKQKPWDFKEEDPFADAFGGGKALMHGRDDLPAIPACIKPDKPIFPCEKCNNEPFIYLVYYTKRFFWGKYSVEALWKDDEGKSRFLFCKACKEEMVSMFVKMKDPNEDAVCWHIETIIKWKNRRVGKLFSMKDKERNELHHNIEYRKKIWHWIRKTRIQYGIEEGGKN